MKQKQRHRYKDKTGGRQMRGMSKIVEGGQVSVSESRSHSDEIYRLWNRVKSNNKMILDHLRGFHGGASGKEYSCQSRRCKRCEFNPWVRKIPWRRKWYRTWVFLPGKFLGQRSLEGYSPWGATKTWTRLSDWTHIEINFKLLRGWLINIFAILVSFFEAWSLSPYVQVNLSFFPFPCNFE